VEWLGLRRAREKSPNPVALDEGSSSSFHKPGLGVDVPEDKVRANLLKLS
jgi:hypothetical protein